MAVDDIALALVKLHDPAIWERVAAIRARLSREIWEVVGANELTAEEAQLIAEAALDEPQTLTPNEFDIVPSRFYPSLTYIADHRRQLSRTAGRNFNEFFQRTYGVAWTIALMG